MANKCNGCGKFVSTTEGVKCMQCTSLLHRTCCVSTNPGGKGSPKWLCKNCKSTKLPLVPESQDKFEDAGEVFNNESIANEMRLLRLQLVSVSQELTTFREELSLHRIAMSEFTTRMDAVENRVAALELLSTQSPPTNTEQLNSTISQLKSYINNREQESLSNDIEISGLTEKNGENLTHIVCLAAQKIGIKIEERDISRIKRVGTRPAQDNTGRVRDRIVAVQLTRQALRNNLLRAARIHRNADSSGLDIDSVPKRFYINERLTSSNRQLFGKAREIGRSKGWRYIWTRDGQIYARKSAESKIHQIKRDADLDKAFL